MYQRWEVARRQCTSEATSGCLEASHTAVEMSIGRAERGIVEVIKIVDHWRAMEGLVDRVYRGCGQKTQ